MVLLFDSNFFSMFNYLIVTLPIRQRAGNMHFQLEQYSAIAVLLSTQSCCFKPPFDFTPDV